MRTYPDYYFTMMMDKYGSGPLHKRRPSRLRSAEPSSRFAVTCGQCTTVLNKKYTERANTAGARLQRMPSIN